MATYSIPPSPALRERAGERGRGHVYSLIEMEMELALAYGKPEFLFAIPHAKKPGKLLSGLFENQ